MLDCDKIRSRAELYAGLQFDKVDREQHGTKHA